MTLQELYDALKEAPEYMPVAIMIHSEDGTNVADFPVRSFMITQHVKKRGQNIPLISTTQVASDINQTIKVSTVVGCLMNSIEQHLSSHANDETYVCILGSPVQKDFGKVETARISPDKLKFNIEY